MNEETTQQDDKSSSGTQPGWRERLCVERNELFARIDRLHRFVNDRERERIDHRQETLLNIQLSAMQTYFQVLESRLNGDW